MNEAPDTRFRVRLRAMLGLVALAAVGFAIYFVYWPRYEYWRQNRKVLPAMEIAVPMRFPNGTSLGSLLKHIKRTAVTADLPTGPPIYIDPQALADTRTTMLSTVTIDRAGAPLKTTLAEALKPLGLAYKLENGLITITRAQAGP